MAPAALQIVRRVMNVLRTRSKDESAKPNNSGLVRVRPQEIEAGCRPESSWPVHLVDPVRQTQLRSEREIQDEEPICCATSWLRSASALRPQTTVCILSDRRH